MTKQSTEDGDKGESTVIHAIIVEDDPMVAQINREYLERFDGFHVEGVFSNGRDALDFLRHSAVHLAIVDQYMPALTGNELLREMRAEGIRTAVIMVTSASEAGVVAESLRYGVVDYLIKPFTFERFAEAIARYRARAMLLHGPSTVDQQMVDRLVSAHKPLAVEDKTVERGPDGLSGDLLGENALRKGLNQMTLDHIYSFLLDHPQDKHTCKSISEAVGLSKVTVRSYLNYLIEMGRLVSSIDYETGGRPRVLYRLEE